MAKKRKKRTKLQNSEVFDNRLNEILLGNVKKLSTKNRKLLKEFKEKSDYIYLFYCLNVSSVEFDNWNTDIAQDSIDDKFNRLIYLMNKNLDGCIEDLYTSMMSNTKEIVIPEDTETKKLKKLVSYKEIAKKVGL